MENVRSPNAFGRSQQAWSFWKQKYEAAQNEKEIQAVLSEELQDAGYAVHSEVKCVLPLDGSRTGEYKTRRIDLWAMRRQQDGIFQPLQDQRIMPGCAFGVELKYTKEHRHISDWRVVAEQAKSGLLAFDWHTSSRGGRSVPKPQYMLVADNTTLLQDTTIDLAEQEGQLMSNGCSILHRDKHGGLFFRIHVARTSVIVVQVTHHQHRAPFVLP
jgi:hypothetical protein